MNRRKKKIHAVFYLSKKSMYCRLAQHCSLLGSLITSTNFVALFPGTERPLLTHQAHQTHTHALTFSFNHALLPALTCTHPDTFTLGYMPNSWHSHPVMFRVLHPHLITITPSHSLSSHTSTSAAHLPPRSIIIRCD